MFDFVAYIKRGHEKPGVRDCFNTFALKYPSPSTSAGRKIKKEA